MRRRLGWMKKVLQRIDENVRLISLNPYCVNGIYNVWITFIVKSL